MQMEHPASLISSPPRLGTILFVEDNKTLHELARIALLKP